MDEYMTALCLISIPLLVLYMIWVSFYEHVINIDSTDSEVTFIATVTQYEPASVGGSPWSPSSDPPFYRVDTPYGPNWIPCRYRLKVGDRVAMTYKRQPPPLPFRIVDKRYYYKRAGHTPVSDGQHSNDAS